MFKILVLAKTEYDYNTLYTSAKQVLGDNINRTSDLKGLKGPQKFYASISEFLNSEYTTCMDGLPLDHFSYTLGIILEDQVYFELLEHRCLSIIGQSATKRGFMFAVVSATLRGWRDAVIDGCSKTATDDIRSLYNEIYNVLVNEGLKDLWSDYSKINFNNSIALIPCR